MPDIIVGEIEDRIIRGELKAGQTLPSERELSELFGVGKYTVREALRMLEASGLIKVKQGSKRGPIITTPSNHLISDFLRKALFISKVSIRHIIQFRLALELSIIEILGEKLDKKWLSRIEDNVSRAKRLHRNSSDIIENSSEFHILLARATENPMFVVLMNTLMSNSMVIDLVAPLKHKLESPTIQHHQRILNAIKAGNPEQARAIMQRHLLEIDEVWKRHAT
jgi:GntR family transcriptional regulator, transcriptional repressor for pyruvate dehydrogenase complex